MLRYLLRSGEVLTSVYVESAALEMHSFGLGETIGQAQLRNVNGLGEYDRTDSSIHGSITLSLMGDPTLTMNIVPPVTNVTASLSGEVVNINWTGNSPKYRVYRASSLTGDFQVIAETDQLTFTDPSPGANRLYMVRAVDLIQSRSGSYYAGSTGVIAEANSRLSPGKNPVNPLYPVKPLSTSHVLQDLDDWMQTS
jgi:hypothetical protein